MPLRQRPQRVKEVGNLSFAEIRRMVEYRFEGIAIDKEAARLLEIIVNAGDKLNALEHQTVRGFFRQAS